MGSDASLHRSVYAICFFDLEELCKKMLLDICKRFPSGLKDATTPYFHPQRSTNQRHESVKMYFLRIQHLI